MINLNIMRRILLLLISFLLLVPSTFAAFVRMDLPLNMDKNEVRALPTITISAEAEGEINADHGINIIIPDSIKILWDNQDPVDFSGPAADAGKVGTSSEAEYWNGYKVFHIPVLENFAVDEELYINNLRVRAYKYPGGPIYLGYDFNGDMAADDIDMNVIMVNSVTSVTDRTQPYPVTNFDYVYNSAVGTITLTWNAPPDYDFTSVQLERVYNGLGNEIIADRYVSDQYVDTNFTEGDDIKYVIYTLDDYGYDIDNGVELVVSWEEEEQEEQEEEQQKEEEEQEEETELEQLDRLYNYYQIRYSIKCMPSGVPVPENDSACLWARIDLVYAQELLDRSLVETSVTEHDRELMSKRVKYPEQRYQENCVEADEPASNCSALGKALERIHYFID